MRTIICFCILFLFFGCGEKVEEKAEIATNVVKNNDLTTEFQGELDPIANTDAKKGGTFHSWGSSFPKSLNMFLDYNSFSAEITGLFFEPLVKLHSTRNEPVGVLAESWKISEDKKTFTFHIHPEAKWSDGNPVIAEDIQFYYDVIMNPKHMTSLFRVGLKRFSRPKIIDVRTVEISTTETHWSNFWEVAGMIAFPKHAWKDLDFNKLNFEFPVVSGPYNLKEVKKNRYITLDRRADWWGEIKGYNHFKFNFQHIKYKFMEDQHKVLEAFKKGEFDTYAVYSSAIWKKKTDFDQVKKGWVVRQSIYNQEPKGFQGFSINLRKEKFQNKKLREALCHLLNREIINEKLMYNEYFLLNSYYPDLYPENINPSSPLRKYDPEKARALLAEAGWEVSENGFLKKDEKPLEISFLTSSSDQRHLNVYVEDLKKVGIKTNIEQLSQSSVRKRIQNHNFDLFWVNWGAVRLRDPEAMWHSSTANEIATNNMSGVRDNLIDQLIEDQKTEMSLDKRNELLRKIDQRLDEIIPYVFLWQADHHRLLYWNRFGTPKYVLDKFNREDVVITYWWVDPEKEKKLTQFMKDNASLPTMAERVDYFE